jgi:hypothetical protein
LRWVGLVLSSSLLLLSLLLLSEPASPCIRMTNNTEDV